MVKTAMKLCLNLHIYFNIGIKHGFSCINVCQVPREVLKTEAEGPRASIDSRWPSSSDST